MTKLKARPVLENRNTMSSEKMMIFKMVEQIKQVEKKFLICKKQALS